MKKQDVDKMTLQEALDYAVSKIVEQGKQCLNSNKSCVYGDSEGNHCAVGWLLDEDGSELMNYKGAISSLAKDHGGKLPNLIKNHRLDFDSLQYFHDSNFKEVRGYTLTELIRDYPNLDFTKPHWQQWVEMGE